MQTFYHGTSLTFATQMAAGAIDVTRGGGEFGRGFYTQHSKANATAWAINRFSQNQGPCALELRIEDTDYKALDIKLLDLPDAKRLTQRLRRRGTTDTHLEGKDVVVGPLNLNRRREQQKFESHHAENLLNSDDVDRRVV